MIKLSALLLICGIVSFESHGQEDFKRKNINVELLGSGVFGSVNYDFLFKPGNDGLGMRVGIGYIPSAFVIPIGLNGLVGKKKFAFEYGAGVSAAIIYGQISRDLTFSDGVNNFGVIAYGKTGMRISPRNNGLVFNIHWNPMLNAEELIAGWFGVGIGYSWKEKI